MSEVKRYWPDHEGDMEYYPDGKWVNYDDYAAMEDRFFVAQGIQENAEKNQGYAEFMQKRAEDQLAALQAKLSAVQAGADRLAEALEKIVATGETLPDGDPTFEVEVAANALAAYSEAGTGAGDAWMPIETALPSDTEPVLLTVENAAGHRWVIRAFYAHRFTESTGDEDADGACEYNEEKDEYFLEEGWYEQNQYEETHWRVGDKAIAWKYMPLPAPPIHKEK